MKQDAIEKTTNKDKKQDAHDNGTKQETQDLDMEKPCTKKKNTIPMPRTQKSYWEF